MVKFFDIFQKNSAGIGIRVNRQIIPHAGYVVYAVYDSTPEDYTILPDFYTWRAITVDTPNTVTDYTNYVDIYLTNTAIFPSYSTELPEYVSLLDKQLKLVSGQELEILNIVMPRVDLVRRRLPNPGAVIDTDDGIGDGGLVGYAGGFSKKFTVDEYLQFINGALIEINITSPCTKMWWSFQTVIDDMNPNPYTVASSGVSIKVQDLIVQGSVIRALVNWGLLEVDMAFSSVDSSLAINFDRQGMVASWMTNLVNNFYKQLAVAKMDFVNSYGVAVGSTPYQLLGLWGNMAGMVTQNSPMAMSTMMGYGLTSSRPM